MFLRNSAVRRRPATTCGGPVAADHARVVKDVEGLGIVSQPNPCAAGSALKVRQRLRRSAQMAGSCPPAAATPREFEFLPPAGACMEEHPTGQDETSVTPRVAAVDVADVDVERPFRVLADHR